MINRYSRPEMQALWSDLARYKNWLEIETLALEKMAELGLAPKGVAELIRQKGEIDVDRVHAIESEVKHDVIALLTAVAEKVGPEARTMHRGMTSSDVLDTGLALQFKLSGEVILKSIDTLLDALKQRALEFKMTPCIGRSHGIHAEPISFGTKLIGFYAEIKRQRRRFRAALKDVCVGKISGAVGTYSTVPPEIESYVLEKLGLGTESVSTQIVQRDRHAAFFSALALLASSLEKIAVEIRHLQRTEVREAEEAFTKGQKGSSAMPHKRNPILTENISGLARLMRGYAQAALESVALWHERDISHSSVERVIAPDACILIDFMLVRMASVIRDLVVYPERMVENLEYTRGLVFSGTLLNMLVDKGIVREEAYQLVQKHALEAWEGGATLRERIECDPQVAKVLSPSEITDAFDLSRHMRHVELIFERALSEEG